jgi:hypothetical protein
MFEDSEIAIARILARSPKMSHITLSKVAAEARLFRRGLYISPNKIQEGRNVWEKAQENQQVVLGVILRRHPFYDDVVQPEIHAMCADEEAAAFIFKTLKEAGQSNIAFIVDLTDALNYSDNPYD